MPLLVKPPTHHFYGWRPSKPDFRDRTFAKSLPPEQLPDSVDLRPQCPPVWDQGALGSCTSQAAAALICQQQIRQGVPQFTPSRLFIYYCERWLEGHTGYDSGAEMRDALKSCALFGFPAEELWDYDIARFRLRPNPNVYAAARSNRITDYAAVPQNLQAVQSVLAHGSLFMVGVSVFESFESDYSAKTGEIRLPLTNEHLLGGHALVVVGYDNASKRFRFRNSWSAAWGQSGYGYLPYAYLLNPQLAADFWTIQDLAA